jgi:Rrf2 family protein
MKLSLATVYAMHALTYLARQKGDHLVASHHIARSQGIPKMVLLKILGALGDAGMVVSRKGPHGGCRLAKKPKDISMLEVTEALDGPLQRAISFEGHGTRELDGHLQAIFDQAAEAVRRQYQKVRLADLVDKRPTT